MRKLIALLMAAIMLLCVGCGGNETETTTTAAAKTTTEVTTTNKLWGWVAEGYEAAANVTAADTVAVSIKNYIDNILTDAMIAGYGAKDGTTKVVTIEIKIENGVWSANVSNCSEFDKTDGYSWETSGAGHSAGDSTDGVKNATERVEIKLANLFPDIKTGFICATIYDGKCQTVYYVKDNSEKRDEFEYEKDGTWAKISSDFWGDIDGLTNDRIVVGTAPMLISVND